MPANPLVSRRVFLTTAGLAVGAAGVYAATRRASSAGAPEATPGEGPRIPRRPLGKTGLTVPLLLYGGGRFNASGADPRYREALAFGANYFDTADCYDGCEEALGRFLASSGVARDSLWITSKSCPEDPDGFTASLDRSLARIGTDHLDAFFIHALDQEEVLDDPAVAARMKQLKEEGKARCTGFSSHAANMPELLMKAAKTPWVDMVMFRYNFRKYGDDRLNAAMDAAHDAGVGLIAMKTQGSALQADREASTLPESAQWNRYQLALKAVWQDTRLSAAVSLMDSIGKLRQNVAVALDEGPLSAAERAALHAYAADTADVACLGCDHLCNAAVDGPVQIGAVMRHLMYADVYGQEDEARARFAALPDGARDLARDFRGANAACPQGIDVAWHMDRARERLA